MYESNYNKMMMNNKLKLNFNLLLKYKLNV